MRTVAHEPVSPVAIPAKDSIAVWESEALDLVVDLSPGRLAVSGAASVDVVEREEVGCSLPTAGAGVAIGGEDFGAEFCRLASGVGADVFAVGFAPCGVIVPESLAVGFAALSVSLAAAGAADVPPAGGAPVDDELVSGSSLAAPLTGPLVH